MGQPSAEATLSVNISRTIPPNSRIGPLRWDSRESAETKQTPDGSILELGGTAETFLAPSNNNDTIIPISDRIIKIGI